MRIVVLTIVMALTSGVFTVAQADDGNPDTPLNPQTAWLVRSTPQWRVWVTQRVTDSGPSYPELSTRYYRESVARGETDLVYAINRGWYHPKATVKLLRQLAKDEDQDVRCRVASRDETPINVLEKLAGDADAEVARCAKLTLQRHADADKTHEDEQGADSATSANAKGASR